MYSSACIGIAVVLNNECSLVSCDAVLHLSCFPAVVPPFKPDFLSCRPTVSAKMLIIMYIVLVVVLLFSWLFYVLMDVHRFSGCCP